MIGLIALIIVGVMINDKAKELGVKASPYIFGSIILGVIPSLLLLSMDQSSVGLIIGSSILQIVLCVIPYFMLKDLGEKMKADQNNNK